MLRILYISPYYKPAWFYGGPPKCIAEQAEYLVANFPVSIDVVTLNKNGGAQLFMANEPVVKDIDGVRVHYLPSNESFLGKKYYWGKSLRKYLRELGAFDIVHIHTLFNHFSEEGMRYAHKSGIPYLITPHGMLDSFSLTRSVILKKIHRFFFDDFYLARADAVQFTTEAELTSSVLKTTVKSVIIPIGFSFSEPVDEFRTVRNEIFRMIFLGRINRKKGIDVLVEGIGLMKDAHGKLTLDLFGEDDDNCLPELKQKVKEYFLEDVIKFRGKLAPEQRNEILRQYDCLVLTSYQENFGLVVVEALEQQVPVLVSDKVNLAQFIIDANCGWVTKTISAEVANSLEVVLRESSEERTRKGINGRRAVLEHFDISAVSQVLFGVYLNIRK